MGALVYVGTFLAGNSFDYRLVSLLLVVPLLLCWSKDRTCGKLPVGTLTTVVLSLWIGALSRQLHLWDEVASWALAAMLLILLAQSAPPLRLRRRVSAGAGEPAVPAETPAPGALQDPR
jgi:hypothetical protein